MPSPFQGIDIASSALRAFQQALDVTGNNITNVNTPGYTREAVNFNQVVPTSFYSLSTLKALGQGVGVSSVNRIQDAFLAARQLTSSSDLGSATSYAGNLKQVESVVNETTGAGISNALDTFFNAWSALAANPNQQSLLTQVQQAGQTLADKVRGAYSDLANLGAQQTSNATAVVQSINKDTQTIADLNAKIRSAVAAGEQPNQLLDQRDQALQDLSSQININTVQMSDGSLAVYSSQFTLVDSGGSHSYPTNFDPATSTVSDANGTYSVRSGQLAGLFQAMNATAGYQSQLDTLANTLRTQVNALSKSGTNALGNTGVNFFNDSTPPAPQTGASDFDLDPAVKASALAISAGTTGNPGDGSLALSLSNLRNSTIAGLGNQTMSDYFTSVIGKIGTDSSFAQSALTTKTAVATQITNQIQSVSGVSLDDEMANMLRFQRSYEAAARALSVCDQTTQDLLGLIK